MFRDLILTVSDRYRVIAPDLPGFENTKTSPRGTCDYTFDDLAKVIGGFTVALGLKRYAITGKMPGFSRFFDIASAQQRCRPLFSAHQ